MIREPGTTTDIETAVSPEQQATELAELVAATAALTAQRQRTASAVERYKKGSDTLNQRFYNEECEADESLSHTLGKIREALNEGNLDNQTAAQLWAKATGNDFPVNLFDQIDQVSEGVRLMEGDHFYGTVGAATGEVVLSLHDRSISAHARIEDGLIAINDETRIGDAAIIAFLRQKLESPSDSRYAVRDLEKTVEAGRQAKKAGVEVPAEFEQVSHRMVGELLDDDVARLPLYDRYDKNALLSLLKQDALTSGRADNIDSVLRRLTFERDEEESRVIFREAGKALDMVEHGEDSVFARRGFTALPTETILGHNLRAEMSAYSRYMELCGSEDDGPTAEYGVDD